VIMIDGEVESSRSTRCRRSGGTGSRRGPGFDPRPLTPPYRWFRVVPRRIQAWREAAKLPAGAMRDGPLAGLQSRGHADRYRPSRTTADGNRRAGPARQRQKR
jgi:hypothetical protein